MTARSIAVELVSVSTRIDALPGDQLMIYQGTCIGVYRPEGGNKDRVAPQAKYTHTPNQILSILQTHGPCTAEQICDYLGISTKDKSQRASVQRRVRHSMINQGLVTRHPEDKHSRFPRYIIPPPKTTRKAA